MLLLMKNTEERVRIKWESSFIDYYLPFARADIFVWEDVVIFDWHWYAKDFILNVSWVMNWKNTDKYYILSKLKDRWANKKDIEFWSLAIDDYMTL